MSARMALAALAASLILAAGSAAVLAQETASHTGGEVYQGVPLWPGHAASDHEVAREGRAAMPFTVEQIEALGRLLRETQEAASLAADPPPEGRVRRVRIGSPREGAIPAIAVRKGYVTAVSFTDATGAPWPIEEVLVDVRFLPQAASEGGDGRVASHLLYLAPQARSLHGNAVIKLRGLAEPLVASIRGGGAAADFRVEVRLSLPGPNAAPHASAPAGFHAGDPVLLNLLGGVAPPGAKRLMVEGGGPGARAWRLGGDLLLATRADLLSPGPWAAERGAGGRWAYRLPDVPYALVTRDGRERRLGFQERDEVLAYQGVPLFPATEREENGDDR